MTDQTTVAAEFEGRRAHLRAVAQRLLGSREDAEEAVQEAWLRLQRTDGIDNLGGWLTTVVARIALDMLRARRARPELPVDLLDIQLVAEDDPEQEALLADSVGLALLVVLDALTPPERLAFVLHDVFGLPFDEIAPVVERSPEAARKLASRARRRIRDASAPGGALDAREQRRLVDAFLAATRAGDFDALLEVLDPDVVLRATTPALTDRLVGAHAVARRVVQRGTPVAPNGRPALVGGRPGLVAIRDGRAVAVAAFRIADGRVAAIDIVADPARLAAVGPLRASPSAPAPPA